jgi:hypothetical protein
MNKIIMLCVNYTKCWERHPTPKQYGRWKRTRRNTEKTKRGGLNGTS